MVCVWPPQNSISWIGAPDGRARSSARRSMEATSARAFAGSRNSSTYFMPLPPALALELDFARFDGASRVGEHRVRQIPQQMVGDEVHLLHPMHRVCLDHEQV